MQCFLAIVSQIAFKRSLTIINNVRNSTVTVHHSISCTLNSEIPDIISLFHIAFYFLLVLHFLQETDAILEILVKSSSGLIKESKNFIYKLIHYHENTKKWQFIHGSLGTRSIVKNL